MKTTVLKWHFLMLLVIGMIHSAFSQKEKNPDIKSLIDSKSFMFVAQSVTPLSGRTRMLTSEYDMTVTENKIVTYLPYFGVAYAAPINPAEGGVNFTSTNFNYIPAERKKGWQILIKPNDVQDVQQLILDVSKGGFSTLQVISTNRQAISYTGYITIAPKK